MEAPANYEDYMDPAVYAYNRAYYCAVPSSGGMEVSLAGCNVVTVSLRGPDVTAVKTASPESGTADAPSVIGFGDDLSYTISIKNTNSAEVVSNVKIRDILPDKFILDFDNIKYYFGTSASDAALVSGSGRVSVKQTGLTLVFTVDKLAAGEQINLIIPGKASSSSQGILENTASVTEIDGYEVNIDSEPTYHIIKDSEAVIEAKKELTGRDLEKGEFSFVVKEKDGNVVATGVNKADGSIEFGTIHYDAAGTYEYIVTEVNNGIDGITYDDTEYTVTVKVVDNIDGTLTAVPVYPDGAIVFRNSLTG